MCNTKNIELVKSHGASKVIDYLKEDFTKNNEKYDVVFYAVGKSSFFDAEKYRGGSLSYAWGLKTNIILSIYRVENYG